MQCVSCVHCPHGRSARVSHVRCQQIDAQHPGPGRRELAGKPTRSRGLFHHVASRWYRTCRAFTAPQGPARPCTYGTRFGTGTACGKGRGNRRACALPRSIGTPAAASLFDDVHRGRGYRRLLGPHRRAGPVRREAARGSRSPSDTRRRRRGAECVGDGPGERPR